MIYLQLFLAFLKIGIVSFGGGYGMISIIRETVTGNGWLTDEQLINFIAVAESTPGPIAVNMATFIGNSQAGIAGAALATFGVVLPAFVVILLIAGVTKNFLKYAAVQSVLRGIRPCIIALIMSTSITMAIDKIFGISSILDAVGWEHTVDIKIVVCLGVLIAVNIMYVRIRKKKLSAIATIGIAAAFGIAFM